MASLESLCLLLHSKCVGQVTEITVLEVNRFIVVHDQEVAENLHLEQKRSKTK